MLQGWKCKMKQMGYSHSTSVEDSRQKQNNKLNKIALWSSKLILFCQIAEHKDHTPTIYLFKKKQTRTKSKILRTDNFNLHG